MIAALRRNGLRYWEDSQVVATAHFGLWGLVKSCGDRAWVKKVPSLVLGAAAEAQRSFLEGLMDGDGHRLPSGASQLHTTSVDLVAGVVELATKLGYGSSTVTEVPPRRATFRDGRSVISRPSYFVTLSPLQRSLSRKRVRRVNYKGNVWCLTVPNGNFLVERNGRFTFSGNSMAIYGDQRPPFTEDMPRAPVDPYGVNKAAMEQMTEQMAENHEFEFVILRPHNVIGPRQFIDPIRNVVTIFCKRALHNQPLQVFGDGSQRRAFSNIRDSLPCYVRAIETSDADGLTVNIGGERPVTILELAELVREFVPVGIEHLPERFSEVHDAFCDHALAKSVLGFREQHGWRAAVEDTIRWMQDDGVGDWEPVLLETPSGYAPEHWTTGLRPAVRAY